jgi:hypothetical protein
MNRTLAIAAIVLLAVVPVEASPRHWFTDKKWWVGEAIIATSVALDAHSTCQAVGRGVETSIAFPGPRSCGATAGISFGAFGFYTALHAAEWHVGHEDPNRVIRGLTPWMISAAVAPIHLHAAVHNYSLPAPREIPEPRHIRIGVLGPP